MVSSSDDLHSHRYLVEVSMDMFNPMKFVNWVITIPIMVESHCVLRILRSQVAISGPGKRNIKLWRLKQYACIVHLYVN